MIEFEEQLRNTLKEKSDVEIDPVVKKKIEATYDIIRKRKRRKRLAGRITAVATVLLVAGAAFTQTAPGASALEYIQMKFFSQSVMDKNFVQNVNVSSIDQGIEISLERAYFDGNELGFTLTVDYSNNDFLVENEQKMIDYYPECVIRTPDGELLNNEQTGNYSLDTKNHVNRVYVRVYPETVGGFSNSLDEMTLNFRTIHGIEKNPTPGYSEGAEVSVDGNWTITVKKESIETFDGVNLSPTMDTDIPVESATAYASGFAVKLVDTAKFEDTRTNLAKEGVDTQIRLRVEKGSETTYYERTRGPIEGDSSYLIFDYTGYKEPAKVYLEVNGIGEVELLPVQ